MNIKSIRFEPGTITPDAMPRKLEVVTQSDKEPLTALTLGVCVGELFVPWHRVHSCVFEPAAEPASVPGAMELNSKHKRR